MVNCLANIDTYIQSQHHLKGVTRVLVITVLAFWQVAGWLATIPKRNGWCSRNSTHNEGAETEAVYAVVQCLPTVYEALGTIFSTTTTTTKTKSDPLCQVSEVTQNQAF